MALEAYFRHRAVGRVAMTSLCAVLIAVAVPAAAQYQWQAVVGGGAAVGNGFGDAGNQAVGAMAVFNGRLFAAVGGITHQAFELWWTDDGTTWNKHPDDGFGDTDNEGVAAMVAFGGFLYAGTTNASGSQVFRTADGVVWTEVNSNGFGNVNNQSVTCLTVHDGQLFAGTENADGGQIWRTTNGTLWLPVMTGGFGLQANIAVASLQGYATRLYAGTYRDSTSHNQPGEIWWSENLSEWHSAVAPGFGDSYNIAIASLAVFDGHLFAGTSQLDPIFGNGCEVWRWNGAIWQLVANGGFGSRLSTSAVRFYHYNGELLLGIDNLVGGGKLMRFEDVLDWDTLVSGGFGNVLNLSIVAGAVFNSNLYLGTANATQGCEVHREIMTVFVDGFESGDTIEWSASVP